MVGTMSTYDETKEFARSVCRRALDGELYLDVFWREWPEDKLSGELFAQIRDDVEDAVTHYHLPDDPLPSMVRDWKRSDMYLRVWLDQMLLGYTLNPEVLLSLRKSILRSRPRTQEDIEAGLMREIADKGYRAG
jgi:hypothetical protein